MFFVLTTGRSGSKSIANYLSSFKDVLCIHEPEPILIEEATLYLYGKYSHEKIVQLLKDTRKKIIDGKQYGESNQKLSFIIPALQEAFHDSKYIWLVRDGREVVNSTFSLGWYDSSLLKDSKWQKYQIEAPKTGDINDEQWRKMNSFEKCCWYWSYTNKIIKRELDKIEESRWVLAKLEDINYDEIFKLLGLKSNKTKMPWVNKKRKLKENSAWKNWDENKKNTFKKICGQQMDEIYPGWITRNGKWEELSKVSIAKKVKHFLQNLLVNVPGKTSLIYRSVKWFCDLIFRSKSPVILNKLDSIYRKMSGEE